MANIREGSIVSQITGSVGTETYARNQGGAYVRARTTPADPNTQPQQDSRTALATLSQQWSGLLSFSERADWRAYGRQHPLPDKWGHPHVVKGYNHFIRCNHFIRRDSQVTLYTAAPNLPPLWAPLFSHTADAAGDAITVALPIDNYPGPRAGTTFYLFAGTPQPAGVAFFNGPWQYIEKNAYNGSWTSDPWTAAYPWPITVDDQIFLYLVAQDTASGAISTRGRSIATAA